MSVIAHGPSRQATTIRTFADLDEGLHAVLAGLHVELTVGRIDPQLAEGRSEIVGSLPGIAERLSVKAWAMWRFRGGYEAGVANRIPSTRN